MGNTVLNHPLFAVDMCLSVLQCLLNICCDHTAGHKLVFNCNKTGGVYLLLKSITSCNTSYLPGWHKCEVC